MRNEFVWSGLAKQLPVILLGFLAGCAGGSGDGFEGARGEVVGKVTFKGQAIPAGCIVMFQTKEGPSFVATGAVKADGTYQLSYQGTKQLPGVLYSVQISPSPSNKPAGEIDPADAVNTVAITTAKPVDSPFPAKYASLTTSGLTFDVEAGKNVADFELEEK